MTPRETVLAAMNHRLSDRIPIDFSGHRSSGIAATLYPKLKRALGIDSGHTYIYDLIQQLAVVEPPVLDALGVDTVELGRGFLLEEQGWQDWVLPDGEPCKVPYYVNLQRRGEDWLLLADDGRELGVQKKGCLYFEQTYYPLMERPMESDDFADLENIVPRTVWTGVPHPGAHLPFSKEGLEEMSRRARALRASTDRAILGLFGGNLFELPQWLYRMDHYLISMATSPDGVLRLSEKLCDLHMANLEKWLGAVGPYIDIIVFGDDLGGQDGPLISPEMYRTYYKPFHTKLWTRVRELADVKIMLHCCGSMAAFLPDLIEAGLDAVNPIQISAAGMDTAELKREYGKEITFWGGGCDTSRTLCRGTPTEVTKHVQQQVRLLNQGGGFVFQQVHNIQADVPVENILAMFQALQAL